MIEQILIPQWIAWPTHPNIWRGRFLRPSGSPLTVFLQKFLSHIVFHGNRRRQGSGRRFFLFHKAPHLQLADPLRCGHILFLQKMTTVTPYLCGYNNSFSNISQENPAFLKSSGKSHRKISVHPPFFNFLSQKPYAEKGEAGGVIMINGDVPGFIVRAPEAVQIKTERRKAHPQRTAPGENIHKRSK